MKLADFQNIKESLKLEPGFTIRDISNESWREYEHGGVTYRIMNPIALVIKDKGTTHRIIDNDGVTHCHPIPGNGCALRWFSNPPINF